MAKPYTKPYCGEAWNEDETGKREMDFIVEPDSIPGWCPLPEYPEISEEARETIRLATERFERGGA
ncbi:MAG: hypothetical protein WC481_08885 [Candidatus Omnitrophota bacterium]